MSRVFVLMGILLLGYESIAQPYSVIHYSIPEGLPSSEVYHGFQDSKGFLWFSTDNGVVRFDGYEMTLFHTKDGLEDPVVFSTQEDQYGRLWFRTFSGKVFIYENGKISAYRYNQLLADVCKGGIVMSIHPERNDGLSFTLELGIKGQISATGELAMDTVGFKLEQGLVYKFLAHGLGTDTSIVVDTKLPVEHTMKHWYYPITTVWKNKRYVSHAGTIYEYDGTTLKTALNGNGGILAMRKDSDNHLWVCYKHKGVERYTDTLFRKPWTPDFVKGKSVSSALKDHEGGLWITTTENGVYYVPAYDRAPIIQYYRYAEKLRNVLATDDFVMAGKEDGKVIAWDVRSKQVVFTNTFQSMIMSLFQDSRKKVWVAAIGGGFFIGSKEIRTHGDFSSCLNFSEGNGGNIWGVTNSAIVKFDLNGKRIGYKYPGHRLRNILFADSMLYVADRLGLDVYDTAFQLRQSVPLLAKFKISKVLNLSDSTLLVSTIGNGFLVTDKRNWSFSQFNSRNNFIADNIYASIIAGNMLWLGTEKGVFATDITALLKGAPEFYHFNKKSGLVSDKVNFLGSTNSEIWIFSDDGFNVVDLRTLPKVAAKPPEFYLKGLMVNGEAVQPGEEIKLKHDQTNLEIAFGYHSFKRQEIVSRYRLNTSDPWIPTTGRNIRFSSLAPGNYTLELEYSNDNLRWTKAKTSLAFMVNPPWWQLWYVQLVAFLIFGLIVIAYFRVRSRRLYKQQQRVMQAEIDTLERERNRIAKELHDGVATSLSAIKLMVNQLLRTHQEPLAEDLEQHFVQTIKEIKDIIYGLTPPGLERHGLFTGLKNYVGKLNLALPVKIDLHTYGDEIYKPEVSLLSFRIIQELLSNAVKHSSAKTIMISINSFKDQLSIIFEDDGVGFTYDPEKSGLGLTNIRSRVESVKGKLQCESGSFGTSYMISLPVAR